MRLPFRERGALGIAAIALAACGGADRGGPVPAAAGAAKAPAVEMVTPSRLFPDLVGTQGFVGEEGGAHRVLVDHMRVIARDDGSLERATELLPHSAVSSLKLPSRFGGGFLFYANGSGGTHVWRAESWLAKLEPVTVLPFPAEAITPGLDRLYARQAGSGRLAALDARTGEAMPIAPLPPAAAYGSLVFADGWRGVAEIDLRGLMTTFDAGATWRPLPISERVSAVQLIGGNPTIVVNNGWYVVDQSGNVTFRARPNEHEAGSRRGEFDPLEKLAPPPPGPLGRRPLRAAVEDGFPDGPDVGVVARGGAIGRVSLRDGAILALAEDAYPDHTASCHAVKVGPGWGFICNERDAGTSVYEFAAPLSMRRVMQFSSARFIAASGNGSLVIKGTCADTPPAPLLGLLPDERLTAATGASASPSASPSAAPAASPSASASVKAGPPRFGPVPAAASLYCIRMANGVTRDVKLQGDVRAERVVALADGRIAVLVPPHAGAAGQLVLLGPSGGQQALALRMPSEPKSAARELHRGMWLEGFEERGKAVAGWVESGGTTVGVTVGLDGVVKAGELRDDTGGAIVSGRFALSISDSARAAESSDGGFTWRALDLPERDEAAVLATPTRACGPLGCAFGGWIRVGWGESATPHDLATVEPPKPPRYKMPEVTSMPIVCEVLGGAPVVKPKLHATTTVAAPPPQMGRFSYATPAMPPPPPSRPGAPQTITTWGAFHDVAPPALTMDETGVDNGNFNSADVARIHAYAWGKRGADWSRVGRWLMRFDDRFDGTGAVRLTAVTTSPWADETLAVEGVGNGAWNASHWFSSWTPDRGTLFNPSGRAALTAACRGQACTLYAIAEGQPIQQLNDASGKPASMLRPSSAVRVGETWHFLVPTQGGESIPLYRVELGVVRLLTTLHRSSLSRNVPGPALVRRARSEALGVIAVTPADATDRLGAWFVMPVDLETGALGDPISLGRKDFGGKLPPRCAPSQDGWVFEGSNESTIPVYFQGASGRAEAIEFRARLDPGFVCLDALSTHLDAFTNTPPAATAPNAPLRHVAIDDRTAIPLAGTEKPSFRRWNFRCAAKK